MDQSQGATFLGPRQGEAEGLQEGASAWLMCGERVLCAVLALALSLEQCHEVEAVLLLSPPYKRGDEAPRISARMVWPQSLCSKPLPGLVMALSRLRPQTFFL